jgi:hypothetical protein
LNACENQGKELLAALASREKRPGISAQEVLEIAAARSALQRAFPSLRQPAKDPETVDVTDLWIASEQTPEPSRVQVGFPDEGAIWLKGFLWALDPLQGGLWKVQPESGRTQILMPENRPHPGFGSPLVAWEDRLAVAVGHEVWVFDLSSCAWTKLDLPSAGYCIGVADGKLWAASGEAQREGVEMASAGTNLYVIGNDFSPTLFAASRRRPAEHPMDNCISGKPFVLFPAKGGGVVLGAYGTDSTFLDSMTGQPPAPLNEPFQGDSQLSNSPDLLIRCKHRTGEGTQLVRVESFSFHGNVLLLADPESESSPSARFAYPHGLNEIPASKYVVEWDGATLWVLAWSSSGSSRGASEAWGVFISD